MSPTRRFRSWRSAAWTSAWRRASSAASATPAISATRSGWRRNISAHVFDTLMEAGAEFGIGLFGSRALNALRLEKNYGSWAREYRPIYGPLEAGLDRFVAYGKDADFIGKAAALAEREQGGKLRLRAFIVDASDADVIGDEPIWFDGAVRGWVTSGGYAHNSRRVGRHRLCAEGDRRRDRTASRSNCWASAMRRGCRRRRCSTPISSGCAGEAGFAGMKQRLLCRRERPRRCSSTCRKSTGSDPRYLVDGFDRVLGNVRRLQAAARRERRCAVPLRLCRRCRHRRRRGRSTRVLPDGASAFSDKDDPLTAICAEVAPWPSETADRQGAGQRLRRRRLGDAAAGRRHRMAGRRRRLDRSLRRRHRQGRAGAGLSRAAGQGCLRQRHAGHAPDRASSTSPTGSMAARWPTRTPPAGCWRRDGRGVAVGMAAARPGADPLRFRHRRGALRRA